MTDLTTAQIKALRALFQAALIEVDDTTGECISELPTNAWGKAVMAILDAAPTLLDMAGRLAEAGRECTNERARADGNLRLLREAQAEAEWFRKSLSAIVHCQSPLTKAQVREAAAEALEMRGYKPDALGGDQSPFVVALATANECIAKLDGALADAEAFIEDELETREGSMIEAASGEATIPEDARYVTDAREVLQIVRAARLLPDAETEGSRG